MVDKLTVSTVGSAEAEGPEASLVGDLIKEIVGFILDGELYGKSTLGEVEGKVVGEIVDA